jgi:hypothetical protein
MSLAIDVDKVEAVLLADGWHEVIFYEGKSSFTLDAYEFVRNTEKETNPRIDVSGWKVEGVPSTVACWDGLVPGRRDQICRVYAPLTSILAIREQHRNVS